MTRLKMYFLDIHICVKWVLFEVKKNQKNPHPKISGSILLKVVSYKKKKNKLADSFQPLESIFALLQTHPNPLYFIWAQLYSAA